MKVLNLSVKNFKAIKEENLEIKGNNVYVIGSNGVGKTSILDSIFKILSGKDLPGKITKEGEKKGEVKIELDDFTVCATFNEKTEKPLLRIENKDGSEYKSPRTFLDEKIGVVDFDINTFFNLTPKKQVDFVKQLVGIDFTDLDDEQKKVFDERTITNRKVKELEAMQIAFDSNLTEKDRKDLSLLQKEIQEATELSSKITQEKKMVEVKNQTIKKNLDSISQLQDQIKKLENENAILSEEITASEASIFGMENNSVDVSDKKLEFENAIEFNKSVDNSIKGHKLRNDLKEAIEIQEKQNKALAEIEETKRRIISDAKLPVEGLTFDDSQLYLNGLPFEKSQINTAQIIITALQLNLYMLKDIKIARFDGSLLDNKNMEMVEQWAKENDLQLFVEFVSREEGKLKIEIQE